MGLFSSKSQTSSNVTNTTYAPVEVNTTVGPTVSESQSSSTVWKNTEIGDSFNTVGSYNRSISVSQPVFIAGEGSGDIMKGTGLDLSSFFDQPTTGKSSADSPGVSMGTKIAIGALVVVAGYMLLKRK